MPLFLILLSFSVFADFQKIELQNLNFDYVAPEGSGTVEKIKLGYDLAPATYPVNVSRTGHSYELYSPFIDLSWEDPWDFVYNLVKASTKNTTVNLGNHLHLIQSESFLLVPENRGEYKGEVAKATCKGESQGELLTRIMDDCYTTMDVSIQHVDVPSDFILYKMLPAPLLVDTETSTPADNLNLSVKNGDFSLIFAMKYYVYTNLRAWGHFQYEDNHETIAIRVDEIKFGIFPVTGIVMKKMQEMIKSPRVKVTPPWIKIDLSKKNEN